MLNVKMLLMRPVASVSQQSSYVSIMIRKVGRVREIPLSCGVKKLSQSGPDNLALLPFQSNSFPF